MGFTRLDAHVALNKLQLTGAVGYVSHFMTVWKGKPLVTSFNNLKGELFNLYYMKLLDNDEVVFIETIIRNYLNFK